MSQQKIADIRTQSIGSIITTSGTVTTGSEFGQIRFMQDATAGISLYSTSLSSVKSGDSIEVTGVLSLYRGQLQISPVNSFHLIQSSRPLPQAKIIGINDPTNAAFESMRVTLPCIGISTCESTFDSDWYTIYDSKGNVSKLVNAKSGTAIPKSSISATGIWVRMDNDFQIWAQNITTVGGSCVLIPKGVVSFDTDQTTLTWDSPTHLSTWVEYGIDQFDQIKTPESGGLTTTSTFNNLVPGQLYKARLGQPGFSSDTVYSPPTYFSAVESLIPPFEIYFDKPVDASFSDGSHPTATGSSIIENDVINLIDHVNSTLDIAMYNTTKTSLVQAVQRAVQRGVSVRYIAEGSNSNTALQGTLSFPVYYREADGIMHNKFMIGDADDPDHAFLWTGSTNFTVNQLSTDPNHAYVIRDQALALNYRREFNEMWGSQPNHLDGRVSEDKTDNTAHLFRINGVTMESYFSPSDETNCHILDALKSANYQVLIGLLLLTKEDLIDEIIELYQNGIDVRVIIEDDGTSSLAISRLKQAGVDVAIHSISGLFHHKYAIIDEGHVDSDPQVITGSHNWTVSADQINDENMIIFHDQSVTNIFRQEFEARWSELVSTGTITYSDNPMLTLHPNPVTDQIEMTNPNNDRCTITLIDVNGNIIGRQRLAPHQTLNYVIDHSIPNGIYLVHWAWKDTNAISRIAIQR